MIKGAWTQGGYKHGDAGTLGEDLLSDADNRGWAIRSWKYELAYNGFRGKMILDAPSFGDAMETEVKLFQTFSKLTADGVIGPITGKELLLARIWHVSTLFAGKDVPFHDALHGIVAHESGYDVGAVGWIDPGDRGPTQYHVVTASGAVNLSQAIRPALAIPRLASQLDRLRRVWDIDTAIVSWNVGEGGAEWWFENGKPATGSPSWWTNPQPLGQRATEYLAAVLAAAA